MTPRREVPQPEATLGPRIVPRTAEPPPTHQPDGESIPLSEMAFVIPHLERKTDG